MKRWFRLVIDVDYRPSDPGINNWSCDHTEYLKADLQAGQPLRYKDSSGQLGRLTLLEMTDEGVVVGYGDRSYALTEQNSYIKLDETGRDYTVFELNVYLVQAIVVEDTPAFYRQFLVKESVFKLTGPDVQVLMNSDQACAKYALGRYHYVQVPEPDSFRKAEALFREAAAEGVPDAFASLSLMYSYGDTHEDRYDPDEMVRWRDEALARGSEQAAFRYARNRIDGDFLAPKEPDVVRDEIEKRFSTETDVWPEWYSVLGAAYDALGQAEKAHEVYLTGLAHGSLRCYMRLAISAWEKGDEKEYRAWMEKGMAAGCGWCFILDGDLDEERFQAGDSRFKNLVSRQFQDRFEQGLRLGEGACAYYLGYHSYFGTLGFTIDEDAAFRYLRRGIALGDYDACSMLAYILAYRAETPEARKEAALLRLKAVRYGKDDDREQLAQDYRDGLLDEYRDEIEKYWLPEGDEVDGDDGRWDAYV